MTKKINITKNTFTIHHFDGSWHSDEDYYVERIMKKIKIPGGSYIAKVIGVAKYRGVKTALRETIGWLKRK